jgi:hypothetical protein
MLEKLAGLMSSSEKYGSTKKCVGCGYCCCHSPCSVSMASHVLRNEPWYPDLPCLHLQWDEQNQRHWCALYQWRVLGKNLFIIGPTDNCIMPNNPFRSGPRELFGPENPIPNIDRTRKQ